MALWDQVTFDNLSSCPKFAPNRLKPDLCRDCMQRVTAHKQDAVTEEQLRLALDHLPNCKPASLIDLKDSAGGQLWLGSFKAVHPSFIEQHQIAMVVTAAKGIGSVWPGFDKHCARFGANNVKHIQLDWVDSTDFTIPMDELCSIIAAIHTQLTDGANVLVHCAQGKSRSTSVVIAYLMRYRQMNYNASLALVRSCRPMATPNTSFDQQLRQAQAQLAAS
eukprot:TRINITY_DN10089_c0_g1_i3.p1 TRINITY_DN10089_c0_g1~~TRINITY_DN10089_c0_g1_i3.p1  ORF type:complete len:220 (+),score=38.14 TRINITY_DN10089_c0_g1_i3:39-698(+)